MKRKKRTREEILSWLDAARERKEAWEKQVREEYNEQQSHKKEAADSGYYELEWV